MAGDILVTGATGKAGAEVCRALGAAALPAARRAPPGGVALDLADPSSFDAALAGCRAVFLMRPPQITDMDATLIPFIARARAAGVERIVFLSVAGAEKSRWIPHRKAELALMEGPEDWTILRAGFFVQNCEDAYLEDIRRDSRIYVPAGRGRVAFLDLGDAAARALTSGLARGQTPVLTGPEAITFDELARRMSAALGRDIRYEPASIAGYLAHLRRQGLGWGQAAVQTYLHVGLRVGQAETISPDLPRLLDRPARQVDDYLARVGDLLSG